MLRLFLPKLLHCHSRQIFSAASSSRSIVKQLIVRQDLSSTQKVIGDVASYKDFLPFCTKSKIDGASDTFFYADLTFEWGSFQETYQKKFTGMANIFGKVWRYNFCGDENVFDDLKTEEE